ncbi:MAG: ThiF family adenylyltransferase [Patescibacteria group bacterium]
MYAELVSRNGGLISKETQAKIHGTRIGIAGCGMGSLIAETLCRLGVGKFVLADLDRVEVVNFNHQPYDNRHIGQQKVDALSMRLSEINSEASIRVLRDFISPNNAQNFIAECDIVVDGIDPMPSLIPSLALARTCRQERKAFFYPIDIGYGAILFSFLPDGKTFESALEVPDNMTFNQFSKVPPWKLLMALVKNLNIPSKYLRIIHKVLEGKLAHYPQPITASLCASALVAMAIVKMAQGKPIPFVSKFDPISMG